MLMDKPLPHPPVLTNRIHFPSDSDNLQAFVLMDEQCPDCGNEMRLSCGISLDSHGPIELSWVCGNCHQHNGKPVWVWKRRLLVDVDTTSRREAVAFIQGVCNRVKAGRAAVPHV